MEPLGPTKVFARWSATRGPMRSPQADAGVFLMAGGLTSALGAAPCRSSSTLYNPPIPVSARATAILMDTSKSWTPRSAHPLNSRDIAASAVTPAKRVADSLTR